MTLRTALVATGVGLVCLAGLGLAAHLGLQWFVRSIVNSEVRFDAVPAGHDLDGSTREGALRLVARSAEAPGPAADLPDPRPLREVDVLDDDAHAWSSFYASYHNAGVLVFDADGDGRLDLYLQNDGDTWVRPTDADGTLLDAPRPMANVLYLNRGTHPDGTPRFENLVDAVRANDTFVREELLIENLLEPRTSADQSRARPGRKSTIAAAADLDADGLVDLIVGNEPEGWIWSNPDTQAVVDRFVMPVGRRVVKNMTRLANLGFWFVPGYEPGMNRDDRVPSARGEEVPGANSVFRNLGDRDGDGLPEWEDISRSAGLEGAGATTSIQVLDIDLDGDLDVFAAAAMDHDYWPGGARTWAGGANELFVNQLAQTGELTFEERGAALEVDGVFDDGDPAPWFYRLRHFDPLPREWAIAWRAIERFRPDPLVIDGVAADQASISWASLVQDVDLDGFPDLWIANDIGLLKLYRNVKGERFERQDHAIGDALGNWMSVSAGDLNGDGVEDLFAGNVGGNTMSASLPAPDVYLMFTPVNFKAPAFRTFIDGTGSLFHAVLDGADPGRELDTRVAHSAILPPDTSIPGNARSVQHDGFTFIGFDRRGLDPYEFVWGTTVFDVQNDGRPDLYFQGNLWGRPGGRMSLAGVNPGRLLVNATVDPSTVRLVDLTAEHHAFNIRHLDYSRLATDGVIERRAPRQNWTKRDRVYSYDMSTWSVHGPDRVFASANQDMLQTGENGRGVVAADLNGDGFEDLVVRNMGGYDSMEPTARNLSAVVDGRVEVLPAPDPNMPTLTQFDPGETRVLINQYTDGNWLSVRLVDDRPGRLNRDAIGAEVRVDGHFRVARSGAVGFLAARHGPVHVGLGATRPRELRVVWPDRQRTETVASLDGRVNGEITVSATSGIVQWVPAADPGAPPADPPPATGR